MLLELLLKMNKCSLLYNQSILYNTDQIYFQNQIEIEILRNFFDFSLTIIYKKMTDSLLFFSIGFLFIEIRD
jgi:hypothetical protein